MANRFFFFAKATCELPPPFFSNPLLLFPHKLFTNWLVFILFSQTLYIFLHHRQKKTKRQI